MIENEENKLEKPAAISTDSIHEGEDNNAAAMEVGLWTTRRRVCRPACPACKPYCWGRCAYDGLYCFFGPCSIAPYLDQETASKGKKPSCQHYFEYCYYSMDLEYHCYYYYACNRNHIQVEGKTQFCESFLEDLRELKKNDDIYLKEKRIMVKQTKRYCKKTSVSSNKKFLASLDKKMKKNKKKMDAAYAGDPTYQKYATFDNMYERLNDTDFLFSIGKMILED